jgi:DNA ligase (NAD+)
VIRRASAKSVKNLIELGAAPGCTLELRRSGGVIPWVQKDPDTWHNVKAAVLKLVPKECPGCGALTRIDESLTHIYCTGKDCGGRLARQVEVLAKALGIKMFGPAACKQLVEQGVVSRLGDLLSLDSSKLERALSPGVAKRAAEQLVLSLQKTHLPWKLLGSVGIHRLGIESARRLLLGTGSLDAALQATTKDIEEHLGIRNSELQTEIIQSIGEMREEIHLLRQAGIKVCDPTNAVSTTSLPEGKTNVVVTGDLKGITRDAFKQMVESVGVKLSGSVTGRTAFLITNNPSTTTSKARRARELNIPVINQEEAMAELGLETEPRS